MKIDILPIGLYQENSYVLHDKGHVLFIDPGRFADRIAETVEKNETVDGILLTHGHEDHTGAADDLADLFHTDIYMHENDLVLTDPQGSRMFGFSAPLYHQVKPLTAQMKIGAFDIGVYETPAIRPAVSVSDTEIFCLRGIRCLRRISAERICIRATITR